MKKYFILTLILTLLAFLNLDYSLIYATSSNDTDIDINYKMKKLYFFDIDKERELANPQTAIPVRGYTDEEVEMICSVVMRETGYGDRLSKALVTNVIKNRVLSSKFPNTVEEVLTATDQFPTIVNWYTKEWPVTADTRLAVCFALMSNQDVSDGAVYFYATYLQDQSLVAWFEQQQFCIEHYNQRYFK